MKTLKTPGAQIKLKNILFATDFEASARRALPFAVAFAKRYRAKLYAAHVIPPEAYALASPQSVDHVLAEAEDFARYSLNQAILPLRTQGLSCDVLLGEGNVGAVMQEFAKESAADLIVVGTSSRMGLGKMFLGSVAEELVRESQCPVLAVGPHITTLASDGLHSIVCPIDFSDASERAAQFAVSLAEEYRAHLTLIHVLQGQLKDALHLATQPTEKRMLKLVPEDSDLPYPPEVIVETGSVADRILKLASDLSADIIVMGARGVGSLAEVASHFGSIVHKIVSLAHCPVLTVNDVQQFERK